jgi:hypothetical protein
MHALFVGMEGLLTASAEQFTQARRDNKHCVSLEYKNTYNNNM